MANIWLISGIPGAGKTTTARALAVRFPRGVHIEGDLLQEFILSGAVWPGDQPDEEAGRQIALNIRNQCVLAESYADGGFTPVIDYVVASRPGLTAYQHYLARFELHFVVLAPGRPTALARDRDREKSRQHVEDYGVSIAERWAHLEGNMLQDLGGAGLWLNNATTDIEETVDIILRRGEEAFLSFEPDAGGWAPTLALSLEEARDQID